MWKHHVQLVVGSVGKEGAPSRRLGGAWDGPVISTSIPPVRNSREHY